AAEQCAARPARLIEMRPRRRPPAALAADAVHHLGLRYVEIIGRLLRCLGDEAMHVEAGGECGWIVAGAPCSLAVDLEQRREAGGLAANDGKRKRQAEHAGAGGGLRRPDNGDTDRQLFLERPRIDAAA